MTDENKINKIPPPPPDPPPKRLIREDLEFYRDSSDKWFIIISCVIMMIGIISVILMIFKII